MRWKFRRTCPSRHKRSFHRMVHRSEQASPLLASDSTYLQTAGPCWWMRWGMVDQERSSVQIDQHSTQAKHVTCHNKTTPCLKKKTTDYGVNFSKSWLTFKILSLIYHIPQTSRPKPLTMVTLIATVYRKKNISQKKSPVSATTILLMPI